MTSETYRQVQELLTGEKIVGFAKRLCEYYKFDPMKSYPQTVGSVILKSAARRQMYVGRTINLLRREICLGATRLEIRRAAEHLMVLLNAGDHSLDYLLSEEEHDIPKLEQKYSRKEFLSLDVPFEEIERWIRGGGGYEVELL